MCIVVRMSRTNLDLDDDLVSVAMQRYGLSSKRAAVDFALRRLVGAVMSHAEALQMEGTGWDLDLTVLRADSAAALE